jgi:hypothetical protein
MKELSFKELFLDTKANLYNKEHCDQIESLVRGKILQSRQLANAYFRRENSNRIVISIDGNNYTLTYADGSQKDYARDYYMQGGKQKFWNFVNKLPQAITKSWGTKFNKTYHIEQIKFIKRFWSSDTIKEIRRKTKKLRLVPITSKSSDIFNKENIIGMSSYELDQFKTGIQITH